MKQLRFLILLCLVLTLQACVMPGAIKKDYSLKNKNVAVVSELGNNFHHNIVGTTVFTNNITKTNVKEWQINHFAASHVVRQLSKNGINATEIESDFFTELDGSSQYTLDGIDDKVIKKIKPLGFKSLILIKPVNSQNHPFFYPGYGLTTRYFFGTPSTCIYAMFIVELYDLETNKTVGWEWANALQDNGPCVPNSSNDIAVKNDLDEYSKEQKIEIRKRVESRVLESLDTTLSSMQLFH